MLRSAELPRTRGVEFVAEIPLNCTQMVVNETRFVENDATSRVSRWSYHTAHIPLQLMGESSCGDPLNFLVLVELNLCQKLY